MSRQPADDNVPLDARTFAAAYECPDCDSRTQLEVDSFGFYHLMVLHDESCPWLAKNEGT